MLVKHKQPSQCKGRAKKKDRKRKPPPFAGTRHTLEKTNTTVKRRYKCVQTKTDDGEYNIRTIAPLEAATRILCKYKVSLRASIKDMSVGRKVQERRLPSFPPPNHIRTIAPIPRPLPLSLQLNQFGALKNDGRANWLDVVITRPLVKRLCNSCTEKSKTKKRETDGENYSRTKTVSSNNQHTVTDGDWKNRYLQSSEEVWRSSKIIIVMVTKGQILATEDVYVCLRCLYSYRRWWV